MGPRRASHTPSHAQLSPSHALDPWFILRMLTPIPKPRQQGRRGARVLEGQLPGWGMVMAGDTASPAPVSTQTYIPPARGRGLEGLTWPRAHRGRWARWCGRITAVSWLVGTSCGRGQAEATHPRLPSFSRRGVGAPLPSGACDVLGVGGPKQHFLRLPQRLGTAHGLRWILL